MLKKILPIFIFAVVDIIVFRAFFLQGLLPIPSDIVVGVYYPWLDYKWGYPVAVPVKNPMPSDVVSFLYPWRVLSMDQLKSGSVPLWDQTTLLGQPLLANFQAGVLNPLNVLFLFLSDHLAWSVEVVLQPFLACLAMYVFLINLKLSRPASVLGSLAYAFSGFSIVWLEYNTIGYTLAVFPLALFFIDRIIQQKKIIWSFLLSLALTFQFFSGYPQICLYTIIYMSIYFIWRYFENSQKDIKVPIIYFLAIIGFLFLSAIQLLPSQELLQRSVRNIDTTAVAGSIQFLPFKHLITLFVPDFFGNPGTNNYYSEGSYDNFAFSLSPVVLFFAIIALVGTKAFKKRHLIFLIFIILALLVATPNPLSFALINMNFLQLKAAVAARIIFVIDFSLAYFASLGVDFLFGKDKTSFFRKIIPLAVFVGLLLGGFLSYIYIYWQIHQSSIPLVITQLGLDQVHSLIILRNTLIPFIAIVILTLGLAFLRYRKLFLVIILFLTIWTIVYSTDKYLPFVSPALLYPKTELIDQLTATLGNDRFEKEKAQLFPSDINTAYHLNTVSGQNALALLSVSKYLSLVNGTYPNMQGRFLDVLDTKSPLLATLDVKYFLALNRAKKESTPDLNGLPFAQFLEPPLSADTNVKTVRVLKNNNNLGLAWFSKSVECVSDELAIIKNLLSADYIPSEKIYVNCQQPIPEVAGQSQVIINQYFADQVRAEVLVTRDNYLIFSIPFYPGWKSYVDGQETLPKLANDTFIAVLVPAGQHLVELRYLPDSFYLGLKMSIMALTGWFFILIFSKLKLFDR